MPDDDRDYGEMHGRLEYMRGRHEALEDRVNRLELSINQNLGNLQGKLDLLAANFSKKMEEVSQHIAAVTARSGLASAMWSAVGGSLLIVGWEVISTVFLKGK